jgi:hypothetical protein
MGSRIVRIRREDNDYLNFKVKQKRDILIPTNKIFELHEIIKNDKTKYLRRTRQR